MRGSDPSLPAKRSDSQRRGEGSDPLPPRGIRWRSPRTRSSRRCSRASAARGGRSSPIATGSCSAACPTDAVDPILDLPFPAPELGGVSGKRELHNATRKYFDVENRAKFPVCEGFCQAFQDKRVTDTIAERLRLQAGGSYLRVEYGQDTDSFWLEPHTDLGVKMFTMLLYMSKNPQHRTLGTDIYDQDKKHVGASPFAPNAAMVFVPSGITYHGFEPRKIEGVRKSVIINYVTNEWRAREQLAFPGSSRSRRSGSHRQSGIRFLLDVRSHHFGWTIARS